MAGEPESPFEAAYVAGIARELPEPALPAGRTAVVSAAPAEAFALRGCVLTRTDANGRSSRDVVKEADWMELLVTEFRLRLDDVEPEMLRRLWQRVRTEHEAWDRASRP